MRLFAVRNIQSPAFHIRPWPTTSISTHTTDTAKRRETGHQAFQKVPRDGCVVFADHGAEIRDPRQRANVLRRVLEALAPTVQLPVVGGGDPHHFRILAHPA